MENNLSSKEQAERDLQAANLQLSKAKLFAARTSIITKVINTILISAMTAYLFFQL